MKTGNRQFAATLLLMLVAGVPTVCLAEIYGWIDSNGVVTYSNLPPPGGVDVTQVIHEDPVATKAAAEAAQRAETAAIKDRLQLLELELSRAQRAPVDYPPALPPAAVPADLGCGPYGYDDCNDLYWYWGGWWPRHGYYRGRERGYGPLGHGRPVAPIHSAAHSGGNAGGGGHAR